MWRCSREQTLFSPNPPTITSPQSSDGGINLPLNFANLSTSPPEPMAESNEENDIEEVMRNSTVDVNFSGLEFSQDPIDLTLFSDFGK